MANNEVRVISGLEPNEVVISVDRLEQLIIAEAHYENILILADKGVHLCSWKDELEIDMDQIEKYLLLARAFEFGFVKERLLEEKQLSASVKEGEV